ncbi:hypothetical protein J2127_000553 [Methanococcus voltae]|uniref:hypothetical protein n=1 Tax=Methanococcus voltae TaxID=2188 RepID=UPI001AE0EBA3|nr:hypothetical protein [Methanococcus voltae]MBP2143398.1 hypothetical protein [Methanococcus voltae]
MKNAEIIKTATSKTQTSSIDHPANNPKDCKNSVTLALYHAVGARTEAIISNTEAIGTANLLTKYLIITYCNHLLKL